MLAMRLLVGWRSEAEAKEEGVFGITFLLSPEGG